MSYEKFTFSIENDGTPRTYSCTRLSPKVGADFGSEVYCDICNVLNSEKSIAVDFDNDNFNVISFVISILSKVDPKGIMARFKYILANTKIVAIEQGSQKEYILGSDNLYNEWFAKYPQDTFLVVKSVIWENATPFLPSFITETVKNLTKSGAEALEVLQSRKI